MLDLCAVEMQVLGACLDIRETTVAEAPPIKHLLSFHSVLTTPFWAGFCASAHLLAYMIA